MKNRKRTDLEYADEKTVKVIKILEVLGFEPVSVKKIIERVGEIPNVKVQLKIDSTTRILRNLRLLGYARQDETSGLWMRTHKRL